MTRDPGSLPGAGAAAESSDASHALRIGSARHRPVLVARAALPLGPLGAIADHVEEQGADILSVQLMSGRHRQEPAADSWDALDPRIALQLRLGSHDAGVVSNVDMQRRFSSIVGGALTSVDSHSSARPDFGTWRHVDELVGVVAERGRTLHRGYEASSTAVPDTALAWPVLDALHGIEHGVRELTIAVPCTFQVEHDVAALRALRATLTHHHDAVSRAVITTQLNATVDLSSPMPGADSAAYVGLSALTASLAQVDALGLEGLEPSTTPGPALGWAVRVAGATLNMLHAQAAPTTAALEREIARQFSACERVVAHVLDRGAGSVCQGLSEAGPGIFRTAEATEGRSS